MATLSFCQNEDLNASRAVGTHAPCQGQALLLFHLLLQEWSITQWTAERGSGLGLRAATALISLTMVWTQQTMARPQQNCISGCPSGNHHTQQMGKLVGLWKAKTITAVKGYSLSSHFRNIAIRNRRVCGSREQDKRYWGGIPDELGEKWKLEDRSEQPDQTTRCRQREMSLEESDG